MRELSIRHYLWIKTVRETSKISRGDLEELSKLCLKIKQRLGALVSEESNENSFFDSLIRAWSDKKKIKKIQPHLTLLIVGAQDALRHPVALVGYLDGFEARSLFDEYLRGQLFDCPEGVLQIEPVKAFLLQVFEILAKEFNALASRDDLSLHPRGPKNPGPARTIEVARAHLEALALKAEVLCSTQEL